MVSELLVRIRDTLADPLGDRWSDDRLLRLIDQGQKDLMVKTKGLRARTVIGVVAGREDYSLPDDVMLITRVTYNDKNIPLRTREQMDRIDSDWETKTGDVLEYIVYNKNNYNQVRVYPILTGAGTDATTFSFDSDYGSITAIDGYGAENDYGLSTQVYNSDYSATEVDSEYGVIVGMTEAEGFIVYYVKKPNKVLLASSELDINEFWHTALKYYVCGHALRDDMDTQNRQFGIEELALYELELGELQGHSSEDYAQTAEYSSNYRRT